ncbi:hypothetical protein P3S68_000710 [Capsicum galapagoense]
MNTFYSGGEVAEDLLTIQSIKGSYSGLVEPRPGPVVTVPKFIFSCSPSYLTQNLGKDVEGMIGFGQQSPVSFATQLASTFRFGRQFAICLSPFNRQKWNNLHCLSLNRTLLSLDKNEEVGGMRISTAVPYTVLEPSIYDVVSKSSVSEMPKEVKMVPAVQPFKTCFDSTYIGMSRLGYNAPKIDIVLHKPNVYWTITGANSLVKVSEKVICLPFVERNQTFGQAIVIGGYQMQDILVEFDLARSRIGYSNSLYFRQTTCSNQFYT